MVALFRFVSVGDIARAGSYPPNVAAVYHNTGNMFALPVGYDLVRIQERLNKLFHNLTGVGLLFHVEIDICLNTLQEYQKTMFLGMNLMSMPLYLSKCILKGKTVFFYFCGVLHPYH